MALARQEAKGDVELMLVVRIHFIIVMIMWTGLAPWEFESLFQVALHLPSSAGQSTRRVQRWRARKRRGSSSSLLLSGLELIDTKLYEP